MSSFFSSLSCCWFWLLLGGLIGWLLNRFMCKCCYKPSANQFITSTPAAPAKLVDVPAAPAAQASSPAASPAMAAPVVKNVAPVPAVIPKARPKAAPKVATVIDFAAAKKAGFTLKNANDLTVIEGIGPKINELFNNTGVKTFAQLAKQTVPQMRKVLDDGGSRFRIANPSTWGQQAALAAQNKWEELKKLQANLSGGVKK